jgi:hypothetical protein
MAKKRSSKRGPASAAGSSKTHVKTTGSAFPSGGFDAGAEIRAAHQDRSAAVAAMSSGETGVPLPPGQQSFATPPRPVQFVEFSGTGGVHAQAPPLPLSAAAAAKVSARAELTLTPEPVTIVPTPYPDDPGAPLVVSDYVRIDVRSAEFSELNAKLDRIVGLLDRSNQFSSDTQKQLATEIQAGRTLLTAPKPDRTLIQLLLTHPLHFIATAAAGAIIGQYAIEALQLLQQILRH